MTNMMQNETMSHQVINHTGYSVLARRILLCFILILAILSTSGCASIGKRMDSWVGHHQSELIHSWGPPNQIVSDGAGGSILIYSSYVNLGQTPGTINHWGYRTTYTAPQNHGYQRTRMFYVDSKGIIYSWRWQGL